MNIRHPQTVKQWVFDMDDKKEVKVASVSISDTNTNDTETQQNSTDTDEQIEKLTAQVSEITDKYLRTAAELENTRRRAALDIESAARNRTISITKKFLPVMDAIESAKKHNPDDAGIKSMALAMDGAFAQIGITKIESIGQPLNPMFHNAVQVVPIPADANPKPEPNTIATEMQTGYMFGDTVLRTAMVSVYK